jgi:hypothetical protein
VITREKATFELEAEDIADLQVKGAELDERGGLDWDEYGHRSDIEYLSHLDEDECLGTVKEWCQHQAFLANPKLPGFGGS